MKHSRTIPLVLAALLLSVSGITQAQAQGPGLTRQQVQMDRETFLSMFRWNESTSDWVLKSGMAPPRGVMTREEVIAMRDKFLSMNYWDETLSEWKPVNGTPRDMSKLSREQVERETVMFLMMHRFDESTSQWVSKMHASK
jgi:hypothetical protein